MQFTINKLYCNNLKKYNIFIRLLLLDLIYNILYQLITSSITLTVIIYMWFYFFNIEILEHLWSYQESMCANPYVTDISMLKLLITKMIFGDNDGHMKSRDSVA